VKQVIALRWGMRVSPLLMSALSLAAAPDPYELDALVAAGICLALLAVSLVLRSDAVHLASFGVGASLLALSSDSGGPLVAAATVVTLLVLCDLVWLGRSLFGIIEWTYDPEDVETVSRHRRLLKFQAWRSAVVGLLAFAVTVVTLTTALPVVAFANPVSGTGLLTLGGVLLALLAGAERGAVADLLRSRRTRQG
jgi:hypothetical protein